MTITVSGEPFMPSHGCSEFDKGMRVAVIGAGPIGIEFSVAACRIGIEACISALIVFNCLVNPNGEA